MAVIISGSSKTYKPAPEGNHAAACVGVYELGTQETSYGLKPQIRITWELVDELMSDGRPFVMGQTYTVSLDEKASLKKALEAWRGKPFTDAERARFDVANLLGKGCLLNVIHKPRRDGNGDFAAIQSISPLIKGMSAPKPQNPLVQFSIAESGGQFPEGMPEWICEAVKKSPEWQRLMKPAAQNLETASQAGYGGDEDEDIPF